MVIKMKYDEMNIGSFMIFMVIFQLSHSCDFRDDNGWTWPIEFVDLHWITHPGGFRFVMGVPRNHPVLRPWLSIEPIVLGINWYQTGINKPLVYSLAGYHLWRDKKAIFGTHQMNDLGVKITVASHLYMNLGGLIRGLTNQDY